MAQPTKRKSSSQEVADVFDVRVQTVHEWAKQGCPNDPGKGRNPARYDLPEVAAWLKENNRTGKPGRPTDVADSPDLEAARLRKENALAAKYEFDVAERRREVVPIEEVKAIYFEEVGRAKGQLAGFPADVAAQCEGLDAAEIQGVLQIRIDQILNDLARGLNQTVA